MKYRLLLLLTALIWGAAFVAQRVSGDTMGPFAFNGVRYALGTLSVLPLVLWQRETALRPQAPAWLTLPRACFFLGLALFAGTTFQQVGMIYTTAGKAGFITALYIVAVPLLGFFIGQPFRLLHLVGLGLAMVGLYLLAFQSGAPLNFGDLLELCGVLFWGFSILGISSFVKYYASIVLAFGQLLVCTLLNFAALFLTGESLTTAMIMQTLIPILYAGIMSSGVAYTLQVFGQAKVPPTEASLLLSMEMVFGALSGYLLLGETMNSRELLGCALMACGIFAAQVPSRILWQKQLTRKNS